MPDTPSPWRKAPPTESGVYWYREPGDRAEDAVLLDVVHQRGKLRAYSFGMRRAEVVAYMEPGLWAGPIHPPESPH